MLLIMMMMVKNLGSLSLGTQSFRFDSQGVIISGVGWGVTWGGGVAGDKRQRGSRHSVWGKHCMMHRRVARASEGATHPCARRIDTFLLLSPA